MQESANDDTNTAFTNALTAEVNPAAGHFASAMDH